MESEFKTLGEARHDDDWIPPKNGQPISAPTLWRWRTMGVAGETLSTKSVGGTEMVSREQIDDFFDRVGAAKQRRLAERRRAADTSAVSDTELNEAGLA